jgi:mannosyl-3-phosphoglycerate synthase
MRITYPYQTERLGAVKVFGVQHIFELDSGPCDQAEDIGWGTTVTRVPEHSIQEVERRMAIVVPCRDERLKLLEGVLTGIPHPCLIILVSNSSREPADRFMMEKDSLSRFCRFAGREAVAIHQADPGLGLAFAKAGFPEVLNRDGLVHSGKGEAMMIGITLAALAGKDFVGFVDADNYVPGAINEYVRAYAADFHLASSRFAMVRISWHSKPKVVDGSLFFNRWGRTSEVTNRFLNMLVGYLTGFGTESIRTGNAGEHAMTIDLARRLRLAGGFAIEPRELLDLFEQYGGVGAMVDREVMQEGVDVFQVETRNPHFHEDKGGVHIDAMRSVAVNAVLNSSVCPDRLRDEILEYLQNDPTIGAVSDETEPIYPPLRELDEGTFLSVLANESETLEQLTGPEADATPPIDLTALQPRLELGEA